MTRVRVVYTQPEKPQWCRDVRDFQHNGVTIAALDSLLVIWGLLAHFFLAATMGLFLLNVSFKFLAKIKGKAQQKLIDVFGQHPRSVWILMDG